MGGFYQVVANVFDLGIHRDHREGDNEVSSGLSTTMRPEARPADLVAISWLRGSIHGLLPPIAE